MKYNITYQGSNFKKWFDIDSATPSKIDIKFHTLERDMTNEEILKEIKPEEITLDELAYILKEELIDKKGYFLFHTKDGSDITRAVCAYWFAGLGWFVDAFGLGHQFDWLAGSRVVSPQVWSKDL